MGNPLWVSRRPTRPTVPRVGARVLRLEERGDGAGGIRTPAPALGEHTDAVLAEAGLAPAEIAGLRQAGAIA